MGGKGSGDRTHLEKVRDTIAIIRGTAPDAAAYLRDIITGKVKRPSWIKFKVCEFIIDHEIGKPPQRHELTGAGGIPLTWQAVILLAAREDQGGGEPLLPPAEPIQIPKEASQEAKDEQDANLT